jgi:hypothetical protein
MLIIMSRSFTRRARYGLFLLASTLGLVLASFGLAHCGGGGSGANTADTTGDGSTGSLGDSTVPVNPNMPADDSSSGPSDASGGGAEADVFDAGIPCDAASGCPGSTVCCSSHCADLAHDPRNCGSCGNACSATQFCTGTLCDDAVFTDLCANKSITVVNDPYAPDEEAGASLGQAIAASCPDAGIAVAVVPQTQPGVLAPGGDAGWRPNTGGSTTLVAGGGAFGQLSVEYMDDSALTPVYLTNDGTTSHIYERATGLALVTAYDSALGAQHDFFMLELAVEPQSGTLCLFGEGIYGAGTVAAGYYGSKVVVPNHASSSAAWYVYEWTDTNNDMTPDQGDTFNLVAQGR